MTRRPRAPGIAALLLAVFCSGPAGAELAAEQIDEANASERLIGGPDAIGGIGDWYLANDVVEVIVDDPSRRHGKLNHGGTVVDAGLRSRRGEDQFARLFPIVNLDQRVQLNYDTMRAEVDPQGRFARLVVTASGGMSAIQRDGGLLESLSPLVPASEAISRVVPETVYEVRPGEQFVRITTTLRNSGDAAAPIFSYGDVWMRGGRSMRSFVGNTLEPEHAPGFHHRNFDRRAILRAADAMAASTFVALAGLPNFLPISYGIAAPERAAAGLRQFGVTGEHVTLLNAFVDDDGWEEMGLLRIAAATRGELPPGGSFVFERRLYVTGGGDVSSSTDRIFPALGYADGSSGIEGRVEPAGVRASVLVETPEGWPVTQTAVATAGADAGHYRAVLPPGRYTLVLRAEEREPVRLQVEVPRGGFAEAPLQQLPDTAWLDFEKGFADGGPGRVVVIGTKGTPDPVFHPELLDFRIDDVPAPSGIETNALQFIGKPSDPRHVAIPPGSYRLVGTRGPEFEVDVAVVELDGPGARARVAPFVADAVVGLRDVLSADFHVHAQASDDSGMSNADRLASFVAEHVDVMVSTDHDNFGYFEPVLDALDVRDRIRVLEGVEVTSSTPSPAAPWTIGHHNAWPMTYRPQAHRKGAPPSQDLTVGELYELLRRDYGAQVVQLNHALYGEPGVRDGNYLSHLGSAGRAYEPDEPIDAWPNRLLLERAHGTGTRAIDFDAMEVMNGSSFRQYKALREAWYSLLAQGFRRTATGNSDSHGPGEVAGYPRNYVYADGSFDLERFDAAVRDGRLFCTNGPLLAGFQVNDARMGDVVGAGEGGEVKVHLAVAAAPWVPVEEVRLLANGEVVRTFRELAPAQEVLRLDEVVALPLQSDAFVTVEAGAPLDTDPDTWAAENPGPYLAVAPGFVPQAISNPIWVDVDGDGAITPPRLRAGGSAGPDAARRQLTWLATVVIVLAVAWVVLRRRAGLAPRR